jgi:hypothetical protein
MYSNPDIRHRVAVLLLSLQVGGLLGLIAVFLVQKNRDLLLGRSMSATDTEVGALWIITKAAGRVYAFDEA